MKANVMSVGDVLHKINFPVAKQEIFLGDRKSIKGRKAIVRQDTGETLGVVSDNYRLLNNKDVFTAPLETVTSKSAGYNLSRFSILKGGRSTLVEALSKEDFKIAAKGSKEEIYKKRIILTNSYDATTSLKMLFGAWRLVCSNGAGVWVEQKMFRVIHLGSNSEGQFIKDQITENLELYEDSFKAYLDNVKTLAAARIRDDKVESVIGDVLGRGESHAVGFGDRTAKQVVDIYRNYYQSFGSLLGVYHAITQQQRDYERERENVISLYNVGYTVKIMKSLQQKARAIAKAA